MNPPVIPDHTLLRMIGRGAYGEVWLARNVMGASRAVKIIWRRQFESDRPYDREFAGIQRYEPVSRSSGGLVHVLHVGRNDAEGYFYYVMELADAAEVPGVTCQVSSDQSATRSSTPHLTPDTGAYDTYEPRTLRSDLKRCGRLPTADCLRLALDVTSGLAELHRHGLVHRDVKPGNIIYVHGRAKLADIGLVSIGDEGRTFVGTEGYIPPEGPGSPAADLYALGIALYEASTGNSPDKFPDVPAEWFANETGNEAIELHEIILKACEGQRERRYEKAEAMQADLALLQSGRSLRRVRVLEQRYARLRLTGIVGTILLVCAVTAVFFANYRARLAAESRARETHLREQAQSAQARAEGAERDAREQLYTALLGEARAVVRSGELGHRTRALDALQRAATISNTVELRREVFTALTLPDLRFERELPISGDATFVELDPAFERYALCRGRGPVEIYAVSDNRLLASLAPGARFQTHYGKWSPDGKYLAFKRDRVPSGVRADVEVWEVANARRALLLPDVPTGAMAFHPRQPWLMANGEEGVAIWDLETGRQLKRFECPSAAITRLQFSPDGERFAALRIPQNGPNVALVNSAIDGSAITAHEFAGVVLEMDWHPSGRSLATVDQSGAVLLMDSQSGETRLLGRHKAEAAKAAFSPDGRYLVSGGWERELICWDMRTMQRAFTMTLDSYTVRFRADGRECAVVIETPRRVLLHAFEAPAAHREFSEDLGVRLRSAAFSADGRWLAASAAERFGVWDLTTNAPGAMAKGGDGTRASFSRSGELFIERPRECSRWRVMPATDAAGSPRLEQLELAVPPGFFSMAFLPDSVVLTGTQGSQITALDLHSNQSGDWKRTVEGRSAVSPDGRWLAVHPSYRPELFVYRLPDLELAAVLTNAFRIGPFEFSPRADEVAAASRLGVEFWSTTTWQRTRVVTNFTDILYMPDGCSFWLTRDFNTAGLYDAQTLQPLLPLPTGTLPLAVSPNGRWLAASVDLRRLQVWDLVEVRRQLAQLGLDWQK